MNPNKQRSRNHRAQLTDPLVKAWHTNLTMRSPSTADTYYTNAERELHRKGHTLQGILEVPQQERYHLLLSIRDDMQSRPCPNGKIGMAPASIRAFLSGVTSWLRFNGQEIGGEVQVSEPWRQPRKEKCRLPSRDGYQRFLSLCNAEQELVARLMGQAGLRPEVLGCGQHAKRLPQMADRLGLMYGDLEGFQVVDGQPGFEKVPARIHVRRELSKNHKPYFTYAGPQLCAFLCAVTKKRLEPGETITAESAVVRPLHGSSKFLWTASVTSRIRKPLREAGFTQEPTYILRSVFRSRLFRATRFGLTHEMAEFLLGHDCGLLRTYCVGLSLDRETLEDFRAAFLRTCRYVEGDGAQDEASNQTLELGVGLLNGLQGESNDHVTVQELESMSQQEAVSLLQERLSVPLLGHSPQAVASPPAGGGGSGQQQIVGREEARQMISEGDWRFVATWDSEQVIVAQNEALAARHTMAD